MAHTGIPAFLLTKEKPSELRIRPMEFTPYNWIKEAKIYNQDFVSISYEWLNENADIVVALFSAKGVDYKGLVTKFYETYENAKFINLPIEVINIPTDESKEDMLANYHQQANWFTLQFGDTMISLLTYMYGVTSIPHLMALRPDGTVISHNGLADFEEYGKNVLVSWLSTSSSSKTPRRLSSDGVYGQRWRYVNASDSTDKKPEYHRKFSADPDSPTRE
ncbi:nucleoredoxin-like protein 2 [Anticarsia gemmatalis]|uniref:nucleoredoxin-like protein 2 n=1 Tax=Anticarsia gemmatalis TaxID=129554 RepID=UPI003F75B25F